MGHKRRVTSTLKPLFYWANRHPMALPLAPDLMFWVVGLTAGAVLKLVFRFDTAIGALIITSIVAVLLHLLLGLTFGLYRKRWRVSSFDEVFAMAIVWGLVAAIVIVGTSVARQFGSNLPTSAALMGSLIALAGMALTRALWRRFWESSQRPKLEECDRTLVFGAGEGGNQIMKSMMLDPEGRYFPVALLDDDPLKRNREIEGVKVRGTRNDIAAVAHATDADVLLIAVPSADATLISELTDEAVAAGLEVRCLPPASELVGGMTIADVRPPTVNDLLGRDPVEIDLESVSEYIRGKRVIITGAGGSIGSELSRQVRDFEPAELFLMDRDEGGLHGLQLSMDGRALLDNNDLIVANIRDRDRMFEVFTKCRPEVVFHAAALKHLSLLENNPEEGHKTNVEGTRNLLDAAQAVGVERFVNISTDKAADPTSVLGATKLKAERLTAEVADRTGLPYVSVRFGNVLGSRGSVLPTFLDQIENGNPITVTDPEVTRYFMTIPEAVRLVVQAGAIGSAGEVLVLDMGEPVKIVDLAQRLINALSPSTTIEYTGLRPGEKLHEILISDAEEEHRRVHPRIAHTRPAIKETPRPDPRHVKLPTPPAVRAKPALP